MGECEVSQHCLNCESRCDICIGSYSVDEWADLTLRLFYHAATKSAPEHPYTHWKKGRVAKAKRDKKGSADFKKRSRIVRRAAKNEEGTRDAIVRQTMRSGALNGDGDTRLGDGSFGIDDKLMSRNREQFTITTKEINKASAQQCVIVVTLATGEKFVVAKLEDMLKAADALRSVV